MGLEERRRKEKEGRKNAILKAARNLFFEKGFAPVTVERIAQKAELSKGSIYLYFNSKEEIYAQILLDDVDKFQSKITVLPQEGKCASEMLLELARVYVDLFLTDRELFRILMNFMLHAGNLNLPEEFRSHLIKKTNKTAEAIEKILQRGIDAGEFSPDIHLRRTRNAIWGLLNGVIALFLFVVPESRQEELIRSTIETSLPLFIAGLQRCGHHDAP